MSTDRLFHKRDIVEVYGLTEYEAQTMMNKIPKINISNGSIRPRWVVRQSDIEKYLQKKTHKCIIDGLDMFGRIIKRQ